MSRGSPKLYRERAAIVNWLGKHPWHYFVTLASITPGLSPKAMRSRFRIWDAEANRRILGLRSLKPHERLFTAAFLEKPITMPHWHLLMRIQQSELPETAKCPERLKETVGRIWKKLTPSGTVDVQPVRNDMVVEYVAKELVYPLQYENMILPLEFSRH